MVGSKISSALGRTAFLTLAWTGAPYVKSGLTSEEIFLFVLLLSPGEIQRTYTEPTYVMIITVHAFLHKLLCRRTSGYFLFIYGLFKPRPALI